MESSNPKLAEIIDALREAVNCGDLGAIDNGVTALEEMVEEVPASEQEQFDAQLEESIKAVAQELREEGLLEITGQGGKDDVWSLTPQGKVVAQLEKLIDIERLNRLHRLSESEDDEEECNHLFQEVMDDLAPIFVWLANNGLLEVGQFKDGLMLYLWLEKKGVSE